MMVVSLLTSGDVLDSVLVALSTRGTRTMAPAKVTYAFQATKRGRGVVKGKPNAKSVRAAGAYPCVRLVGMLRKENSPPDSDRDDWLTPRLPQTPNPRTTPRRSTSTS